MLHHLLTQDADLRMVPTDRAELAAAVDRLHEELSAGAAPGRTRVLTRWIGIGHLVLGNHDEARAFLRRALELAVADGDARAVVATGVNSGDAHRYAGDLPAADACYRSALDTARSACPELLDFALQHFGKHLAERGDLLGARAHLREALRLRDAKGDAELIGSTRDALDLVESRLRAAGGGGGA
ncbi:tetratricopeptide repeat protein [Kitasatospora phosalacinea]|uniref:tetratricopeptide repeat protein n=1 Tax=Kitasatospora phosalacinea TaxID=2065 RepID=UPI002557B0C5|nr:tetratricopeptide repeat protein [Kitasatospora phosalacinea]